MYRSVRERQGLPGYLFPSRASVHVSPAKPCSRGDRQPEARAALRLGRNKTRTAQVFTHLGLRDPLGGDADLRVLATGRTAGLSRDRGSVESFPHRQSYIDRRVRPDDIPLRELPLRVKRARCRASYLLLTAEPWANEQSCSRLAWHASGFLLSFICRLLPCTSGRQLFGPEPSVDALRGAVCAGKRMVYTARFLSQRSRRWFDKGSRQPGTHRSIHPLPIASGVVRARLRDGRFL